MITLFRPLTDYVKNGNFEVISRLVPDNYHIILANSGS